MIAATLALGLLAAVLGLGFGRGFGGMGLRLRGATEPLAAQIDRLLPQTQCGLCGYAGCKPYARAIVAGEAAINQCPPGGEDGVRRLASLLGREPLPLNPANGVAKSIRTVAVIDEAICIGCTKCILACPVDAILGAAQLMHTVIESECTGCELCLAPCPVDCIAMVPLAGAVQSAATQEPQPAAGALPCIRCGACHEACPVNLLPQQIYAHARGGEFDAAAMLGLPDCTECGLCVATCPSGIPLVAHFRAAKSAIRADADARLRADLARERFESRETRLAREQQAQELERARRKAALTLPVGGADDPVTQAIARAKAKADALRSRSMDGA